MCAPIMITIMIIIIIIIVMVVIVIVERPPGLRRRGPGRPGPGRGADLGPNVHRIMW